LLIHINNKNPPAQSFAGGGFQGAFDLIFLIFLVNFFCFTL